jgi:hypothetical protein
MSLVQACIRKIPGSNTHRLSSYPDWGFFHEFLILSRSVYLEIYFNRFFQKPFELVIREYLPISVDAM